MAKLELNSITNLQNESAATSLMNQNSAAIELAMENTFSRDGTSPNEMNTSLDMNSNRIYNLPEALDASEPVRKSEFDTLAALGNALDAAVDAAAASAADAAASAADALITLDDFEDVYLGPKASDPLVDNDGDPLQEGQLFFNTTTDTFKIYDGASWLAYAAAAGLTSVADDPNPALGNDLDMGSFSLFSDTTGGEKGVYEAGGSDPIFTWESGSNPANYLRIFSENAGLEPGLSAQGTDTDISIDLIPKGTGTVTINGDRVLDINDIGSTVQDWDAQLDTWSGVTPGTGVATALAVNVGTDGAFITRGGNAGTPSAIVLTNGTGLPISGLTASTSTAIGVGSVELGNASDTTLTRSAAGKLDVEGHTVLTDDQENQGPITGGANFTAKNLGTMTTGTLTVDVGDCPMQSYTNGGAHTLAVDTGGLGWCTLFILNNASAGAITTSAFDVVSGDPFTTTNGHVFECTIVRWGTSGEYLYVRAKQ